MFDLGILGLEISKAQLIATGLNVVAYLAAGGLSLMLYSAMTKRRWRLMFAEIIEQSAKIVALNDARATINTRDSGQTEPVVAANEARFENHDSGPAENFVSFDSLGAGFTPAESEKAVGHSQENVDSAVTQYRATSGAMSGGSRSGVYTQNRMDVIRLAKEMIASGRTSEHVRNKLPITDSELRLVELGSRR